MEEREREHVGEFAPERILREGEKVWSNAAAAVVTCTRELAGKKCQQQQPRYFQSPEAAAPQSLSFFCPLFRTGLVRSQGGMMQ